MTRVRRRYHKLTAEQKREVIAIYEAGTLNKAQLARSYNVRPATIYGILIGGNAKPPIFEEV